MDARRHPHDVHSTARTLPTGVALFAVPALPHTCAIPRYRWWWSRVGVCVGFRPGVLCVRVCLCAGWCVCVFAFCGCCRAVAGCLTPTFVAWVSPSLDADAIPTTSTPQYVRYQRWLHCLLYRPCLIRVPSRGIGGGGRGWGYAWVSGLACCACVFACVQVGVCACLRSVVAVGRWLAA